MAEEMGTTIVLTGPEQRVKQIVELLRSASVPIANEPPKIEVHPAPEAPEDVKVCTLIIDSRGWDEAEKAATAAEALRKELAAL